MPLFQECEHNGNGTMSHAEKTSKTGNQRTVEADTMEQNNLSSDDEGEDTSDLSSSSTKKGMSLDMYFKVHGINLENKEDEEDELDDAANDEGNGGQASNEGTIKKKTRGKTMCKKLHATDFNDRREVEFFGGQPIGPTKEVVSNLNQLLGTIVRNPRFVTLLYTSWHGMPKNLKEDMWEYANVCNYRIIDNFFKIYLLLYLC
ncbi:hypothetical protein Ahy_B09g097384 [Arachis hypogaea]|uniref:Uncharacterized protein n=1 Tax=Arachis hypogaea TaxID=3818 RepID=A0A444XPL6_ARAHY|nr:hypothetical protein Ahy_B09g097384 [Arachis hypogaea]